MNQLLLTRLEADLLAFKAFDDTTPVQSITDTYNRLLALSQALILGSGNPSGHDRAWSLLKDDAFKDLDQIQTGNPTALDDLKLKISQIGHLLLTP